LGWSTIRSSLLGRFFLSALYASAIFVNTIVAVQAMANPALGHNAGYVAAVSLVTDTAYELSILIVGHFYASF
jgi:hypothetical protein